MRLLVVFLAIFTDGRGLGLRRSTRSEITMSASPQLVREMSGLGSLDWRAVLRHIAVSRALDDLEESTLLPERKVLYQVSARGHELTQVLLANQLTGSRDGVGAYYRSRPLLLSLGLPLEEALASTMMRAGGMSDGRDIGVVFNLPRQSGACVLPVCGGVGTQYTPAVGWAQALRYRGIVLGDKECETSLAVAHGGDASTATNGFWAALNIATTERLPLLFFIEDNGYGISVPSRQQTPDGNIARNLAGFRGLRVLDGDASDPMGAAALIENAVTGVRSGGVPPPGTSQASPQGPRINLVTAVRRTLERELAVNPRMLIFGEDVGRKGGVHAATLGLQEKFGAERVFDTSLSEEGIIGRAVGMAAAGLMPVPEIQFRKYADPAAEQLNDCGTMRWRTVNRFAAPMVVRIPGGFFKCGDPWHSQSNEVQWVHGLGWRVAMPSNAQDAVGLLRSALRGNDPTIFFEHRSLLDGAWARRAYPGDDFVVPFGKASILREGTTLTVVTWGAMVERCEKAIIDTGMSADLLDLRTLSPWDREATLASVRKTRRCLIVHEDTMTAGFGAEIAAVIAREAFFDLDAPIERLAMPDVPSPHSPVLLDEVLPNVETISQAIK